MLKTTVRPSCVEIQTYTTLTWPKRRAHTNLPACDTQRHERTSTQQHTLHPPPNPYLSALSNTPSTITASHAHIATAQQGLRSLTPHTRPRIPVVPTSSTKPLDEHINPSPAYPSPARPPQPPQTPTYTHISVAVEAEARQAADACAMQGLALWRMYVCICVYVSISQSTNPTPRPPSPPPSEHQSPPKPRTGHPTVTMQSDCVLAPTARMRVTAAV